MNEEVKNNNNDGDHSEIKNKEKKSIGSIISGVRNFFLINKTFGKLVLKIILMLAIPYIYLLLCGLIFDSLLKWYFMTTFIFISLLVLYFIALVMIIIAVRNYFRKGNKR